MPRLNVLPGATDVRHERLYRFEFPEVPGALANFLEERRAADPEKYPLQPKKHSLEFLREIAHLRFRTNTFGAVFRIRHSLAEHQA